MRHLITYRSRGGKFIEGDGSVDNISAGDGSVGDVSPGDGSILNLGCRDGIVSHFNVRHRIVSDQRIGDTGRSDADGGCGSRVHHGDRRSSGYGCYCSSGGECSRNPCGSVPLQHLITGGTGGCEFVGSDGVVGNVGPGDGGIRNFGGVDGRIGDSKRTTGERCISG